MGNGMRLAYFDGTWNTVDDDTNVSRMKSLRALGADQLCYYSPGVGTSFGDHFLGGMFGRQRRRIDATRRVSVASSRRQSDSR
jgi:uncharacterized protein (DUF2235 family)